MSARVSECMSGLWVCMAAAYTTWLAVLSPRRGTGVSHCLAGDRGHEERLAGTPHVLHYIFTSKDVMALVVIVRLRFRPCMASMT